VCCLLYQGHTDELWGIASHPNQLQFVTAGNDGVLYLWDALAHVTIAVNELLVS
jgi:microtubule-associated protein-like 1/2